MSNVVPPEDVAKSKPHAGTFEGDDVTHYGGLATFQSTYGTAKGSHSVTGESIRCESDSTGVFVVSQRMSTQSLRLSHSHCSYWPEGGDGRTHCEHTL